VSYLEQRHQDGAFHGGHAFRRHHVGEGGGVDEGTQQHVQPAQGVHVLPLYVQVQHLHPHTHTPTSYIIVENQQSKYITNTVENQQSQKNQWVHTNTQLYRFTQTFKQNAILFFFHINFFVNNVYK
jgi:hypothetical protein